jgi:hypothetical protein
MDFVYMGLSGTRIWMYLGRPIARLTVMVSTESWGKLTSEFQTSPQR